MYQKQTDKAKGHALKDFLTFVLNDGQALAKQAKYARAARRAEAEGDRAADQLQIPA